MNRIMFKVGGTIISLFLVILLPLGFVVDQIFSGFYYNKMQAEIDQLSSRYADTIAQSSNPMTTKMIEMMGNFTGTKLVIVNSIGESIAIANLPSTISTQLITAGELKLLSRHQAIHKEVMDTSGKRFLVSGKPIIQNGTFSGGIFIFSSVDGIHETIRKIRYLIILSGIGAFFLALGFTFILSKKLTDPLLRIEQATRKIAKGDLQTRVKVATKDEIGSLAQVINDLAVELKRFRDTRSEFFANVSHELRTPITYLEGYTKVLKENMAETEEEKELYLDIIHQESGRLARLIHDLFELAKMEEGKIALNFEWVDLTEILEKSALTARLKAKEKGIKIQMDFQEHLPLMYGDGLRIEQIFTNLLNNAIRYTERGYVKIIMQGLNVDEIQIVVEDTGIGIPEDELSYIFERFYRVEKSRSREHGGTGLGLAIVKKLVELQGGRISASSEVGQGTRFELTFPTKAIHHEREGEQ